MKNLRIIFVFFYGILLIGCSSEPSRSPVIQDTLLSDTIQYHAVRVNQADGSILPWYSSDPGTSYDTVLMLVWDFWNKMETDSNGLKYYMNHQVWKPGHDMRGLGGDQVNMALSSWRLLYAYTGYPEIIENMRYMADTYLERSLSDSTDKWPHLPYPYNTEIHSGRYDGDMRNGKGFLQPDKAGSFGYELVDLYKLTGEKKYLLAARRIAGTLLANLEVGDNEKSPLPFRINAKTGEVGSLFPNTLSEKEIYPAVYTSNWTGTMMLFRELEKIDAEKYQEYHTAFHTLLDWMVTYPLKTNKWGPFFEDIPGWSDTQINAISFAMFILEHPGLFPDWKADVKGIFSWTYSELGNSEYEKYNVTVMNEQTVYRVPGNSHSSRQASAELLYTALTGDTTYKTNAIRTLNWATYTVADDGRNCYIRDDIWLTDGYGDYVRHFLRAIAAFPSLAPSHKNRLLKSSSVITFIDYGTGKILYRTYDEHSSEILRLLKKPERITVSGKKLAEKAGAENSWSWEKLEKGGVLQINEKNGREVVVYF